MLTIGICALIGIAIAIIWLRGDFMSTVFFSLIIGFAGALVGFMIAMLISPAGTPHWTVQPVTRLYAMRSADSTNGSFYGSFLIATGDLNTEVKYIYYEETSDGGYQPKSVIAENNENVTVYQNSPDGGSLTISECTLVQPAWAKLFAIQVTDFCGAKYAFNIPPGSLVSQYSIH